MSRMEHDKHVNDDLNAVLPQTLQFTFDFPKGGITWIPVDASMPPVRAELVVWMLIHGFGKKAALTIISSVAATS